MPRTRPPVYLSLATVPLVVSVVKKIDIDCLRGSYPIAVFLAHFPKSKGVLSNELKNHHDPPMYHKAGVTHLSTSPKKVSLSIQIQHKSYLSPAINKT